jgi:flagellar biosynthesis protein FlhB
VQSILKALKSECSEDMKIRERISEAKMPRKADLTLLWLVVLMLVTTLIYMAWSINKIHSMHHSINSIHKEKNEAERKADLFFEAVRNQK